MLSERELTEIAAKELIRIFGRKYLRDTYAGTCVAHGFPDNHVFMLFLGIKGSKDLPGRKADSHGWVVYGKVLVNAETGEIQETDYALE